MYELRIAVLKSAYAYLERMIKRMINYKDFIKQIALATGFSQKNIQEVLDNAEAVLIEDLKKDEEVKIYKTITIVPTLKEEKEGRNPFTGEKITIPAKRTIKAKISKNLKEIVK